MKENSDRKKANSALPHVRINFQSIDQYLKKQRQLGNEIWSVNRIYLQKHFS